MKLKLGCGKEMKVEKDGANIRREERKKGRKIQ
jgi:hypothetical protein